MSGQLVSAPDMVHLIFFAWIYSDSVVLIVPWQITPLTCKTVAVFTHLGNHMSEFTKITEATAQKLHPCLMTKTIFKA